MKPSTRTYFDMQVNEQKSTVTTETVTRNDKPTLLCNTCKPSVRYILFGHFRIRDTDMWAVCSQLRAVKRQVSR